MREQAEKWASFILANLLWCLFVIPLITIPAATAGTFALLAAWSRDQYTAPFETFFGTMRRLWRKATLIGLIDLALGGLVAANLSIVGMMNPFEVMATLARGVSLFVALALLLVNLYVWPLLVLSELPIRALIETSIRLMFLHPFRSIGVLLLAAVPVGISLLLPRAFFRIVTVSTCALIITRGTWPVIRQHVPESALTHRERS